MHLRPTLVSARKARPDTAPLRCLALTAYVLLLLPATACCRLLSRRRRRVLAHPEVQNLARTLAFHHRCQQLLPLDKAATAQLQQAVDDLSETLRCLLCL